MGNLLWEKQQIIWARQSTGATGVDHIKNSIVCLSLFQNIYSKATLSSPEKVDFLQLDNFLLQIVSLLASTSRLVERSWIHFLKQPDCSFETSWKNFWNQIAVLKLVPRLVSSVPDNRLRNFPTSARPCACTSSIIQNFLNLDLLQKSNSR